MATTVNPAAVHGAAQLGRVASPELFTTVNVVNGSQTLINRNLSLMRPLAKVRIRLQMRVVIGTANYSAVAAEAPQCFINRIRIFGTWKNGQQVPWDISGATAFVWTRLFNPLGSSLYINGARQTDPSIPFAQTLSNFGNTGTYDIIVHYELPTFPIVGKGTRASTSLPYLWLPEDWNDTLQCQLNFGDQTSFGTPGGSTTVAFSAINSGSGSPTCDIFVVYQQLGALRGNYMSALVVRGEQQIVGGSVGAVGNMIQLIPLSKQKTTRALVKTGQVLQGTSSAAFVYASLSDFLLDQTQIKVDNKIIRDSFANPSVKEELMREMDSILPQGYFLHSFIDGSQNPRSAFRADNPAVVGPGANYALWTSVITPGSNPAASIIQEQIYTSPGDPFWNAHGR